MTLGLSLAGVLLRRPWHDELFTLELAHRSVRGILAALKFDSGPPGHYLLARCLEVLGLSGIVWLRLVSAVAVAAAVALLAAVATRRWGATAGWIAAGVLVVHPVVLLAGVEGRAYGLLFLASALVVALLEPGLTRRRAVGLAVVLAGSCWMHSLGLVLCGAVLVAGALLVPGERRRAWAAAAVGLALQLPWVPVMVWQPSESLEWMASLMRSSGAHLVLTPLGAASPSLDLSRWLELRPALPGLWWVAPIVGAVALIVGLRAAECRPLAALWAVPALAVVGASLALRPVYFPGRGDVLWVGAAVLILAVVLARAGRVGVVVGAVLLILGAGGVVRTLEGWHEASRGPAADVASVLERFVEPGDVVVTTGWWGLDVRWALAGRARDLTWMTFPLEAGRHPGWYSDREVGQYDPRVLLDRLRHGVEPGANVWLLRSPPLASDRQLDDVVTSLGLVPRAAGGPLWQLWGPPAHRGTG